MRLQPISSMPGAPLLVAMWILALGCGQGDGALPWATPVHRPTDGLVGDPELQALVELQVLRDAAGLTAALTHERDAVRARAALALGSVQAPEAVPALVEALGDATAEVRRDASFALGQARVVDAVGPLAEAFAREGDAGVRRRMLEALGKLPAEASAEALLTLSATGDEEAERVLALARLGAVGGVITEGQLEALFGNLDHPDAEVRASAAYFFGRLDDPRPWGDRAALVRGALDGYEGDDPAAMYLVQGLGRLQSIFDGDRLRDWAATATDWRTRANAMAALAGRELDRATQDVLFQGLDDPSVHVAVNAAQILGRASQPPVVLERVRAWIDTNEERWQVVEPLLVLLGRMDDRAYVLGWIDALAPDDEVRWRIGLQALAYLGGEESVERLRAAAATPSPVVAGAAFGALVERWRVDRNDPRTHATYFDVFREGLESDVARTVAMAAGMLADSAFHERGSLPLLEEAATGEDPELSRAAERALNRMRGAGVEGPGPGAAEAQAVEVDPRAAMDWTYLAALGEAPRLVLDTDRGRIVVRFTPEAAPQTTQTIARFAEEGRYDGVTFHRVVPNFVIQGGDFGRGDGSGGPGFSIRSEFNLTPYERGVIGMASSGKDTEGSQFFITHSMQPHLDGSYTTFGWVVEGMDVVDRILVGDRIRRATVERGG